MLGAFGAVATFSSTQSNARHRARLKTAQLRDSVSIPQLLFCFGTPGEKLSFTFFFPEISSQIMSAGPNKLKAQHQWAALL